MHAQILSSLGGFFHCIHIGAMNAGIGIMRAHTLFELKSLDEDIFFRNKSHIVPNFAHLYMCTFTYVPKQSRKSLPMGLQGSQTLKRKNLFRIKKSEAKHIQKIGLNIYFS